MLEQHFWEPDSILRDLIGPLVYDHDRISKADLGFDTISHQDETARAIRAGSNGFGSLPGSLLIPYVSSTVFFFGRGLFNLFFALTTPIF